jgi:ubiquinone/menaquinone biosynthesis C-methylase UbiE
MKNINSNKEWKKWGEIDPLFGVASWQNKERDGASPWTDQEFYQLGESDWKDFSKRWEIYGVNRESCLEIGCGAGRITMQLASYFNQVHAIDVSEKMIEYAKKNISSSSVSFYLTNGIDIPAADQSVFSVFSTHVFQHFDSLSFADQYFAEISRIMKKDGTLMIHLPVYRLPSGSKILGMIYAAQKAVGDIRASGKRLLMQYGMAKPLMRRLEYPVAYFYKALPVYGFGDIELSIFVAKSNNDPHSFIFARKKT